MTSGPKPYIPSVSKTTHDNGRRKNNNRKSEPVIIPRALPLWIYRIDAYFAGDSAALTEAVRLQVEGVR